MGIYYYSHWGHLVSLCCLQTLFFGPDGKQLKLLQLSYSQFILVNIKIPEFLFTKSPREAADYLTYLKFLAIKGTCFQTKAILAFDQDYRATKAWDNFGGGTN